MSMDAGSHVSSPKLLNKPRSSLVLQNYVKVVKQIYLICIGLSSITRNLHGNHIERYHHHHHHHEEAGVEVTL
jgi:hypothetical protein